MNVIYTKFCEGQCVCVRHDALEQLIVLVWVYTGHQITDSSSHHHSHTHRARTTRARHGISNARTKKKQRGTSSLSDPDCHLWYGIFCLGRSHTGMLGVVLCLLSKPPLRLPSLSPLLPSLRSTSIPLLQAYQNAAASVAGGIDAGIDNMAAPLLVLSGRREGRKEGREGGREEGSLYARRTRLDF